MNRTERRTASHTSGSLSLRSATSARSSSTATVSLHSRRPGIPIASTAPTARYRLACPPNAQQPFRRGTFLEYEGKPYCDDHYHLQSGTSCEACSKPIVGKAGLLSANPQCQHSVTNGTWSTSCAPSARTSWLAPFSRSKTQNRIAKAVTVNCSGNGCCLYASD